MNREDYNENDFLYEKELDKFDGLIKDGYKPCSTWFESMVKKLKYDRRKISQELESAFLGTYYGPKRNVYRKSTMGMGKTKKRA